MARSALPAAVAGIATAGLSVLSAVVGATVLGLQAVFLLVAVGFAFLGASVAYYGFRVA